MLDHRTSGAKAAPTLTRLKVDPSYRCLQRIPEEAFRFWKEIPTKNISISALLPRRSKSGAIFQAQFASIS